MTKFSANDPLLLRASGFLLSNEKAVSKRRSLQTNQAAKAAFDRSIKPLMDAGLVERQKGASKTDLGDQGSPDCYRITIYGSQTLAMLK